MNDARPIILVSACLGDGKCLHETKRKLSLIDQLKPYADLKTVCPELGLGFSAPRSLRVVEMGGERHLIQVQTGTDFTGTIADFSARLLKSLKDLDGCILKKGSPTCGIKDVKIYRGIEDEDPVKKGRGLFTSGIETRFPNVVMEDEGRLASPKARDNFLTVVFAKAKFRQVKAEGNTSGLNAFHDENRLLFMAYNKTRLNSMDKLLKQDLSFDDQCSRYEALFISCLGRVPRTASHAHVVKHVFSIFSPRLGKEEAEFFSSRLSLFEAKKLPLSSLTILLRSYIIRFNESSLMGQTYFQPYPEDLGTAGNGGR